MTKKGTSEKPSEAKKETCESCKFNTTLDDDKLRCEFAKMLGKREPGCEKYEEKS